MKTRKFRNLAALVGASLLLATIPTGMYMSHRAESNRIKQEVAAIERGEKKPFEQRLREADEIIIQEHVANIGKDYDIYVKGERVATVSGKNAKLWGDVFTLKTVDGKVLGSEKEHKRILGWNRTAAFYDPNGKLNGFLGEEKVSDMFTLGYIFHFRDENKNKLGKSQKIGKSAINLHYLYDNQGNTDYSIDKKFTVAGSLSAKGDKYVLMVKDRESSIPLEHAIFLTCIEDAIADSNDD